jgi:hypothetical protein
MDEEERGAVLTKTVRGALSFVAMCNDQVHPGRFDAILVMHDSKFPGTVGVATTIDMDDTIRALKELVSDLESKQNEKPGRLN